METGLTPTCVAAVNVFQHPEGYALLPPDLQNAIHLPEGLWDDSPPPLRQNLSIVLKQASDQEPPPPGFCFLFLRMLKSSPYHVPLCLSIWRKRERERTNYNSTLKLKN